MTQAPTPPHPPTAPLHAPPPPPGPLRTLTRAAWRDGAARAPWRVHDPHRAPPARRRRPAERCGGARADGREDPVPRPRDPGPRRRLAALDPRRRELTMMPTVGPSADGHALPGCRLRRVTEYIQQNLDRALSLA